MVGNEAIPSRRENSFWTCFQFVAGQGIHNQPLRVLSDLVLVLAARFFMVGVIIKLFSFFVAFYSELFAPRVLVPIVVASLIFTIALNLKIIRDEQRFHQSCQFADREEKHAWVGMGREIHPGAVVAFP